jgi:AhpD family alkylhydroperoxidase
MSTAGVVAALRIVLREESPELSRAMRALDRAEHDFGRLDPVIRELVNIRVSQINGCAFCIDKHTRDARAAGETEQRIYALSAWRETPFFTRRERAALALAEAITLIAEGHVPDEVYALAAQNFEPQELAALIWRTTIINALNRTAITTRLAPGSHPRAVANSVVPMSSGQS